MVAQLDLLAPRADEIKAWPRCSSVAAVNDHRRRSASLARFDKPEGIQNGYEIP
jgi:hypothetical protein